MRKTALTVLLLVAAAAPPAAAQEEGVFADPNSPAGKEYALPLERARAEAAPDTGGREGGGGGSKQPLFGVGIEQSRGAPEDRDGRSTGPGEEATGGHGSSNQGGQGDVRRQEGSGRSASSTGDLAPNAYRPAAIEAAASEGSDVLLTAGIAAAVLCVGLFAGFGLRRLLRDT